MSDKTIEKIEIDSLKPSNEEVENGLSLSSNQTNLEVKTSNEDVENKFGTKEGKFNKRLLRILVGTRKVA
jgi:hypothetical protein